MKYSISFSSAFLTTALFTSTTIAQLSLDPTNIQAASQVDGLADADPADVFTPSITDPVNFINFCGGKTLANGLQEKAGSCNGIPMGDIPSADKMVSAIIINPPEGAIIPAFTAFDVVVKVENLQAGVFVNPATQYYASPQQLNTNGIIIGHTHVTIQDLGGSFTPTTPPSAGVFEFFKGINDVGDGNGLLTAKSEKGLPVGFWRVCTINSSSNHQGVLSPVEQRGAQDDCSKFRVVAVDDPLLGDQAAADAIAEDVAGDAEVEAGEDATVDGTADVDATGDGDGAVDADPNADDFSVDQDTENVVGPDTGIGGAIPPANGIAGDGADVIDSTIGDAAEVVNEAVGDAADTIDSAVGDAATTVGNVVDDAATTIQGAVDDFAGSFGQRKKMGRRGLEWRA